MRSMISTVTCGTRDDAEGSDRARSVDLAGTLKEWLRRLPEGVQMESLRPPDASMPVVARR